MKINRNIYINEEIWYDALIYATRNKISLSKIIEEYLKELTKKEKNK